MDRINAQVIYRLKVPGNLICKQNTTPLSLLAGRKVGWISPSRQLKNSALEIQPLKSKNDRTMTRKQTTWLPGRVAQSVTCLASDASLTADPGVTSSIPARPHTFVEIDHEKMSTVILLPSAESFKKGCCQYVLEVLLNCLFKLAQEKVWLGELTVPP